MIIETKNLTKTFRRFEKQEGLKGSIKSLFNRKFVDKTAVDNFSVQIEEGEFVGLIGPNGAGKTTIVKMLSGIIAPTSGEISVMGYYPNKLENQFKKQYAVVMGQKSQLFFELTAADTFLLFKELYDLPDEEYHMNLNYFLELFDVKKLLNVQVRTLSLGERMKMELIVALLHNPRVLFLDEPTIGLDAVAQKQIRTFLREVNQTRGTTILLTSHYMEDIRSLCQRCLVIENSKKIYDGDTNALFQKYQKMKTITAAIEDGEKIHIPSFLSLVSQDEHKIVIQVPRDRTQEAVRWLFDRYIVKDVSIEEEDIGNVVEKIYSEGGEAVHG